ncbi:MAG: FMN-binding glutamate synthase family protein [Pseudomonadota bacterium]|nr:FMN-binding glutamate synthase family protein [Pseudomonadota bacterium]
MMGWNRLWTFLFAALALVGLRDLLQTRHAILRNYPVIGHLRFFLEFIRPEMRQYFIESDTEALPFSRSQRSLVYQRAKQEVDKRPFGTLHDPYEPGYAWINHSLSPGRPAGHDFRVLVGGPDCSQPYSTSLLNISAMSFGALSANAIRALNQGALRGGFAHDTGEGSISVHHRAHGGDLIWEIGTGYFGCRTAQGGFDPERFAAAAAESQVRMVEIKLSQGAKPGHGGVLPAAKVSPEIALARGVPLGQDCISPGSHAAFSTPLGLLEFVQTLRRLSGGKPTGFKLAIGHPWEWFAIVKAMLESGITPDFIVVDGKEGGTGAAPAEYIDRVGVPMREGLLLVHNALVGAGLRSRIRIGAAGKIISAFDMARTLAIGADWCNSARGFMFALGCIQAQSCHTDQCPTGVTTQDPLRQRALVVGDKAERVFHFHRNTLSALADLVASAGLTHPGALHPDHIMVRINRFDARPLSAIHEFLQPGELLHDASRLAVFDAYWHRARADRFGLAS